MENTPLPRRLKSFEDLLAISLPSKIVEIGSWKGQSAVGMLEIASTLKLRPNILCVDTWLGSIEHWTNRFPDSEFNFEALKIHNGEPSLLKEFWGLVTTYHFENQVEILRAPSNCVSAFLFENHRDADLVYIDGDHKIKAVFSDLNVCSYAMPTAILSGDDFSWKSVRLSLILYCVRKHPRRQIYVSSNMNTWALLERNCDRGLALELRGWNRRRLLPLLIGTTLDWIKNRLRERAINI